MIPEKSEIHQLIKTIILPKLNILKSSLELKIDSEKIKTPPFVSFPTCIIENKALQSIEIKDYKGFVETAVSYAASGVSIASGFISGYFPSELELPEATSTMKSKEQEKKFNTLRSIFRTNFDQEIQNNIRLEENDITDISKNKNINNKVFRHVMRSLTNNGVRPTKEESIAIENSIKSIGIEAFTDKKSLTEAIKHKIPKLPEKIVESMVDSIFEELAITQEKKESCNECILNAFKASGITPTAEKSNEIKNTIDQFDTQVFNNTTTLKTVIEEKFPELKGKITDEALDSILKGKQFVNDMSYIDKLEDLFSKDIQDYPLANKLILENLRNFLQSPTYDALKEDSDHPLIKMVHKLASGIWNDVNVLFAYEEMGKAITNLAENQSTPKEEGKLVNLIKSSIKVQQEQLMTDHGLTAKAYYALQHPGQAVASLVSESRKDGYLQLLGTYDPHMLANNPSKQSETRLSIGSEENPVKGRINNCYGGSPTVGAVISPEFAAMVQAAENNLFAAHPDPTIPSFVYYTNLQNIENKGGEGERSSSIMEMQRRYPMSFIGITLAKDSQFYKLGSYGHGEWKNVENQVWTNAEAFGIELKEKFLQPKCFEYFDRTQAETGNGIYLPGNAEFWGPVLDAIVKQANTHFTETNIKGVKAAELLGAYQEYVYTMIQAYVEIFSIQNVNNFNGNTQPLITSIRACKENIDRGGAENAKYLYTRLTFKPNGERYTNEERANLIIGALSSRALSSRNRMILEARLPQILAFFDKFQPEEIQQDIEKLVTGLGIKFTADGQPKFNPALQRPQPATPEK